jgi:dephospho-CoA kinase
LKIGLVGKMRSGKDTVAELLEMKGFVNYKFSSGIKAVYNLLAYDKKVGKDRKILQGIGQGLRKIVGEDVWIHYTFEHAMSGSKDENVLISDCRQPNEAEALLTRGYWLIKVETEESLRIERMRMLGDVFTLEDLNHETETLLESMDCDFILYNNGTLQDLENKVEKLYNYLSWLVDDYGTPLKSGYEVRVITDEMDYENVIYKKDINGEIELFIKDENNEEVSLLNLLMDGKLLSIEVLDDEEDYDETDEYDDYEYSEDYV